MPEAPPTRCRFAYYFLENPLDKQKPLVVLSLCRHGEAEGVAVSLDFDTARRLFAQMEADLAAVAGRGRR